MTTPTLRYALAAAARGWHVFPLVPNGKIPPRGFDSWEHRVTTDPEIIRAWWARRPYNIGIACGPSSLVVLDLDTPKEGLRPPPSFDPPAWLFLVGLLNRLRPVHPQAPLPLTSPRHISRRPRRPQLSTAIPRSSPPRRPRDLSDRTYRKNCRQCPVS